MARSSYHAKLKTVRALDAGASAARVGSRRRKTIPHRVMALFCPLKMRELRVFAIFTTPAFDSTGLITLLTSVIISELRSER